MMFFFQKMVCVYDKPCYGHRNQPKIVTSYFDITFVMMFMIMLFGHNFLTNFEYEMFI